MVVKTLHRKSLHRLADSRFSIHESLLIRSAVKAPPHEAKQTPNMEHRMSNAERGMQHSDFGVRCWTHSACAQGRLFGVRRFLFIIKSA